MKKCKKIRFLAAGLVFALIMTLLPSEGMTVWASEWNNAYTYYEEYGNQVVFCPTSSTNGNIYYASKAATASTNTRYRTIGWKLSVRNLEGKQLQTIYFKLGGAYMNCVSTKKEAGMEYNLYALSLYQLKRRLNQKAQKALDQGEVTFVLDACMVVVKNKKVLGAMDDDGPTEGTVYTNYSGIAGAANWGSSSYASFHNYFNKNIEELFCTVETFDSQGIADIRGQGYYCYGSLVTLSAKLKKGYVFEIWDGTHRSTQQEHSFYINGNVRCTAVARPKTLDIFFHRNAFENDTEGMMQRVEYGEEGTVFEPIHWRQEGKTLVGFASRPDAKTPEYSTRAEIKNQWIDKNSPRMDLYAVWKSEGKEEEPVVPKEDKPESQKPNPPKAGEPTVKRIIHCRFISEKYFEDAQKNLISKEKGGLSEESRWAVDAGLRDWLRQVLDT